MDALRRDVEELERLSNDSTIPKSERLVSLQARVSVIRFVNEECIRSSFQLTKYSKEAERLGADAAQMFKSERAAHAFLHGKTLSFVPELGKDAEALLSKSVCFGANFWFSFLLCDPSSLR